MTDPIVRPAISTRAGSRLALSAAVLAAIPLVLTRLDGDGDLDPFFAALVVAAITVAALISLASGRPVARLISWLIVLAWFAAGAVIAFLLVMYQSACGCSSPDPSSFPPAPTDWGLPATAFHLLATYGGGALLALAVASSGGPQRVDPPA
ncbi:MAG TPA: hypothetical protein VFK35_00840 [Candidatus Limnocylindrales bacterium]|nr:hypothetical protein [Candidatus Limnocylindrales bacterium]